MKISVVVPVYNAEKYIAQTLLSIKHQKKQPQEVVIVNDASTDRSMEIVESWKDKLPEVLILENHKNLGIGGTRQKGLRYAYNPFVAFLSSDDVWHEDFLQDVETMWEINKHQPYGFYSDYYLTDQHLMPTSIFRSEDYSRANVIDWALKKNMFVNFSSFVFPTNDVEFMKDLRKGEDLIFLLDMLESGVALKRIPKPLLYYRIHPQQGTRNKTSKDDVTLWELLKERLVNLGVDEKLVDVAEYTFFHEKHDMKKRIKRRLKRTFFD
ncbi:MAG: glycosyltransferase family 2 protein [Candidatus Hodarchaeales archaeon]